MRLSILLLLTSVVITFVLCRPEKKKSILGGIGKLLKDVLITTTTTTTPAPNFVQELLNRGKNIAQQHYKTNKKKVVETIGEYAEQAGVNRGIAQAVSSQFIDDSIKKGKAYIAQRRNSTASANPSQSQQDIATTHRRTESVSQHQQRQQVVNLQPEEVVEEPMVQQKVELKKGGYGGY